MGGSPEQRSLKRRAHLLESQFPHSPPTVLVTLPSALEGAKARSDLGKLRRAARRINNPDATGWDPQAPAIWVITRGTTFLLIVNGSWRGATWSRGYTVKPYVEHDDDLSE